MVAISRNTTVNRSCRAAGCKLWTHNNKDGNWIEDDEAGGIDAVERYSRREGYQVEPKGTFVSDPLIYLGGFGVVQHEGIVACL